MDNQALGAMSDRDLLIKIHGDVSRTTNDVGDIRTEIKELHSMIGGLRNIYVVKEEFQPIKERVDKLVTRVEFDPIKHRVEAVSTWGLRVLITLLLGSAAGSFVLFR